MLINNSRIAPVFFCAGKNVIRRFDASGTKELADALPVLDSLEKLLLERNKIGVMGAQVGPVDGC